MAFSGRDREVLTYLLINPLSRDTGQISERLTPRLRVTLRVGNEFEGKMHEMVHKADTLSFLVAEQEATKVARKKFRFVEVVSVKSM